MSSWDKTKKQITFDLSIAELRRHYPRPEKSKNPFYYRKAYKDIKKFMCGNEFEWRQGSVYVSKGIMTQVQVISIAMKMAEELPWLAQCVRRMDVTHVGPVEYSLLGFVGAGYRGKDTYEVNSDNKTETKDTTKQSLADKVKDAENRAAEQIAVAPQIQNKAKENGR